MKIRPLLVAALAGVAALASAPAGAVAPAAPAARFVELAAPVPSWFTPELEARVAASGTAGVPLPADAMKDVPVSGVGFIGIRPGSWIMSPAGCTTNFVFQANAGAFHWNQQLYIGTAGHCASVGQRVTLVAVGPGTSQPVLVNIGQVVVSNNNGIGDDFALIAIDSRFNSWVSPSMAHWGGPTGQYTSNAVMPVVHSGHGLAIGTGGTPRTGVMASSNATSRFWHGSVIFGDSGSALNTATGLATANITHLMIVGPLGSTAAGTRIERILQIARKNLSVCPTRTPWPLPGCPAV